MNEVSPLVSAPLATARSFTPYAPISATSLPPEIITYIFSLLPPGSLMMASSTCTYWRSICTDSRFDNTNGKNTPGRLLDINRRFFSETRSSLTSSSSNMIQVSAVIRMIYLRLRSENKGLATYLKVLIDECGLPCASVLRRVLRDHPDTYQLIDAPTDALTLKQCSSETKKYLVQILMELKDFNLILEYIHEWLPARVDQHMLWERILDNRFLLLEGCHDRITAVFNSTNQEKTKIFLQKCQFHPKNTDERRVAKMYKDNEERLYRQGLAKAMDFRRHSITCCTKFFNASLLISIVSKNVVLGIIAGFLYALISTIRSAYRKYDQKYETLLTSVQHLSAFAEWEKRLIGQLPVFIISASQNTLPRDYFCPVSRVPLYCPLRGPDGKAYDAETLLNELKRNPENYRFKAFQLRPDFQLQYNIFGLFKLAIISRLSLNRSLPDPVFREVVEALDLFFNSTVHKMHSKLKRLAIAVLDDKINELRSLDGAALPSSTDLRNRSPLAHDDPSRSELEEQKSRIESYKLNSF